MKYRVHNAMDHQERPFGTVETDDDGVLTSYVRDDGAETPMFQGEIKAGLTLGQVIGSYRNYVFTPEGETDDRPDGTGNPAEEGAGGSQDEG